jgi:predicted Zn-dependent protease with MMP-like domain
MERERFAELVAEAVGELPREFAARLENVEVVIEDEPTAELLREMRLDPRHNTLLGLYQGIPLSQRGSGYSMALPDKITIFYRPIVRAYRSPGAIRRAVARTVIHEVGHFFGLDDDEIRAAGY